MAARSDGKVVISINADAKSFENALERARKKAEGFAGQLDGVTENLEQASREAAGFQNVAESAASAASDAGKNLSELEASASGLSAEMENVADAAESMESEVENVADEADDLAGSVDAAKDSLEDLGDETDKISDKTDDYREKQQKTKKEIDQSAESAKRYGDGLKTVGVTLGAVSMTLVAMGAAAVSAATDFETSFAKTQTIMDTTKLSVGDMREEILDLSITSGMAATDVSEAVYQAISGSVDTADAAQFVSQANKLAVAGFTSLTNATDVLTTALNAYGLEADSVAGISNVLIQTQNLGKTSVDELASSMGKAISTGSAYGVNLENLSTAYVELTRGGIATSEATTYLSGMLNELGDSGSTVGKILQEETGRSFGQLMEDGYSLADVLQILLSHVNGNTEALMGLWGSQEAGKASNAIAKQGLEDFNAVLEQMQQEMSGATTTTEDAYDIMTNTSEFIDARFKNALTNLGIAAGDQLTPALNRVKSALTDVLDGAADLVEDCPAITAGLTGTATAAGFLAVSIGGLMIAKKAKEAMDALNVSMAANPALFIASAVIGLATAVGMLVSQAEEAVPGVDALRDSVAELSETVEAGKQALTDNIGSVEVTADKAEEYLSKLDRLEQQGLKTADAQREYNGTVELLRTLLPDINIQLDEQTGLIIGGTDGIREQIAAWKDLAKAEVYAEKYKEAFAAVADAETRLRSATDSLADIKATDAYKRWAELTQTLDARLQAGLMSMDDYTIAVAQLNNEFSDYGKVVEYQDAIDEANAAMAESEPYLSELEEGYMKYATASSDAADSTETQTAALQEYTQQLTDVRSALSEYETSFQAAGLSIDAFSQTLVDSGISADEATAGIEGYRDRIINATDAISQKSEEDMAKLISNMQQRVEAYQNWNTTIMQLQTQFGGQLSAEFLAFVKNLGPEYNDVVAGWLTDGNTQMTEEMIRLDTALRSGSATAVESYSVEIGKLPEKSTEAAEASVEQFGPALEPMVDSAVKTGTQAGEGLVTAAYAGMAAELPDLAAYAKSSGDDVGYQFALGLAAGIRRGIPAVSSASSDAANVPANVTRNVTQTHSPSKVADAIGYWWPVGLAQGIDRGTPIVESTARTQADAIAETSRSVLEQARLATEPMVPAPVYYENTVYQTQPGGTAQLRASIEVPVYLDGREIARGTAQYMGEQMDFEVI